MTAAAFGGGGGGGAAGKKKKKKKKKQQNDDDDNDDNEEDEEDEDEDDEAVEGTDVGSEAGNSSSVFENGENGDVGGSGGIRGESCVGCVFQRDLIDKIDTFVRRHCSSMTENALYKAAALHWKTEVVAPRRREGVNVPSWNWKAIRTHYDLHCCDPIMQRSATVRTLGAMRAYHEQSLLRVQPDGTKQLDFKAAELMLKLVALTDKQITALDAARMPPPPARR